MLWSSMEKPEVEIHPNTYYVFLLLGMCASPPKTWLVHFQLNTDLEDFNDTRNLRYLSPLRKG